MDLLALRDSQPCEAHAGVGQTRRTAPTGVIPSPLAQQIGSCTKKNDSEVWVSGDPELCSKAIRPP